MLICRNIKFIASIATYRGSDRHNRSVLVGVYMKSKIYEKILAITITGLRTSTYRERDAKF